MRDGEPQKELDECLEAVMLGKPSQEIDAVRDAVAIAVERRWLGATSAVRAGRLLQKGYALEAARLLVPAGWSVVIESVDLSPLCPGIFYVAQSKPEGFPTDPMANDFDPEEDACHMPAHAFETPALALCGEAMMLQVNLADDGRMWTS